ncbi:hypothetical protein [Streptomyces sp. C10-9-1]|uniref:hypothetical protein n=1 Tax=Streptomyces sp. C10-9-1 TaxID=1859285 RepID=UPI003F49CEFA
MPNRAAPTDTRRPALLLDVDGPLNPYGAPSHRRPDGYTTHRLDPLTGDGVTRWTTLHRRPLRVWLNPGHGQELLRLGYDLVWATTWVHEANTMIGPNVGLPELPYIAWGSEQERSQVQPPLYWKTPFIVEWAAGRPFAWVDDEITDADREYVAQHHDGLALLHRVDPRLGLLHEDFIVLAAWAEATRSPVPSASPRKDGGS